MRNVELITTIDNEDPAQSSDITDRPITTITIARGPPGATKGTRDLLLMFLLFLLQRSPTADHVVQQGTPKRRASISCLHRPRQLVHSKGRGQQVASVLPEFLGSLVAGIRPQPDWELFMRPDAHNACP
jgi:hypothetical protein